MSVVYSAVLPPSPMVFLCVAGDKQSSEKRGQPDLQLHGSVQDLTKRCCQQDGCVSGGEASLFANMNNRQLSGVRQGHLFKR